MAGYKIPEADWRRALTDALHEASPGDTVTVGTAAQRDLAEKAARRLGKAVTIRVSPYASDPETEVA